MRTSPSPVAGRLKRPTWRDPRLLIGLALIAVSVVAVATIVRTADTTVAHYSARDTLTPGSVVSESAVLVTHVRVPAGVYIAVDGDPPWGDVVTQVVEPGELIPRSVVVNAEAFDSRPIAVRTSVPLGEGIGRGSLVDVWMTVETEDGPASRLVAGALPVDQVDRDSSTFAVGGAETVYVIVPTTEIAAFLDAIALDGDIAVVGLPGSEAP